MSNKKTRHAETKIHASSMKIPSLAWIVGIVVIIAAIGVKKNLDIAQPPAPTPYADSGQWQKVTDTTALFNTKIFLERDRTFVSIPIKFENKTQTTWLTLQSSASAGIYTYLIAHPVLETLNWQSTSDGPFHLYQKENTYKSFADFLRNPPSESELLIDTITKRQPQFKNLKHQVLTDNTDLNGVKYILTTYIKPRVADGITYYENVIDATNAKVNSKDEINWELTVPTAATSSPYYLGTVHIDYQR